jgi:hypothetical protein
MDELCKGNKFFEPFYLEIVLTLSLLARELGSQYKIQDQAYPTKWAKLLMHVNYVLVFCFSVG